MTEFLIFIIGIVAGFLGATVGGGGMVSIPILILLGFTPQSAIALNKVGDVGAFMAAIQKYWQSKLIDWKMALPLAGITIMGSIIGTQVMIRLETDTLEKLIGIMILIFLPFFFFNKSMGLKEVKTSRTRKIIGFILYSLLAIEGAIVGAGGATVILMLMMYCFGYKIIEGYATNVPAEIFSALVPAIIYSFYGFVQVVPAMIIFCGMLLGGFLGAHLAVKKGNMWVKGLFSIVILMSVLKIMYF